MVSQQLLQELKLIIQEDYGVVLQPQEVSEIGNSLVQFFSMLIKIDTEDEEEKEESYD